MGVVRLKRQRRRYAYTGIASLLAGIIAFGPGLDAAICGMVGVACLSLVLLVQPCLRNWAETLSTGMVLATVLPISPDLILSVGAVLGYLLHQLAYGMWMELFGFSFKLSSHQQRTIIGTPRQIWITAIPGEGHPEDHFSGTLIDFDSDGDDPDTVYLRTMVSGELPEEMMLTFLDRRPYKRCRYMLERDNDSHEHTVFDFTLTEVERGKTDVELVTTLSDARLRTALMRWFDDDLTVSLKSIEKALAPAPVEALRAVA